MLYNFFINYLLGYLGFFSKLSILIIKDIIMFKE